MAEPISPLRILARSASSLAVLHAASMGIAFLIGIMLARLLGASGYGIYGLAMSVATVSGMVAEFGLPALTMREVGAAKATGRWDLVRGLHYWSIAIVLLGSAVLLVGLFGYNRLAGLAAGSPFMAAMLWAALLIPIVALGKLQGATLLSLGRAVAGEFPVLVLRPGLFLLALAGLWLAGRQIEAPLAMVLQVAAALAALLVVSVALRRCQPDELRNSRPAYAWRQWLGAAIPLGAADGLRVLQGHSAVLLLGLLATAHDVGIYRVADSVAFAIGGALSAMNLACAPIFAQLHAAGDRAQAQRVFTMVALIMTGATFTLGLPFLLFGKHLLVWVFGAEFAPSLVPLWIVWGGLLGIAAIGPTQIYAAMAGLQRLGSMSFLISLTVTVVTAVLAIPAWGATGAAAGVAAGLVASNLWLCREIRRRHGFNSSIVAKGALGLLAEGWNRRA